LGSLVRCIENTPYLGWQRRNQNQKTHNERFNLFHDLVLQKPLTATFGYCLESLRKPRES
jgi:hypothetical protein